jgi:hypothetical protein
MARVKGLTDAEAGRVTRGVFAAASKRVGEVPDPLRIMAHSKGVMWAAGGFEIAFGRARSVPAKLKVLASLKAAALIGCVF